jgi:hypothetical protein
MNKSLLLFSKVFRAYDGFMTFHDVVALNMLRASGVNATTKSGATRITNNDITINSHIRPKVFLSLLLRTIKQSPINYHI